MADDAIRFIFVYGSLRPDDDSGQTWTQEACHGMKGQRAMVRGARLFYDRYAAVKLLDDRATTNDAAFVHGWVLTSDDADTWFEKLSLYDRIEGYRPGDEKNSFYQRCVVPIELAEGHLEGHDALGNPEEIVKGFIYHKPNATESHPIHSGDWLNRNDDR
eukprot:CAMPEP_0178896430 /NCGR_PEP_ID=MMETSP0786-20121207/1168_1 /TAXON_ID=186022 /ORGANISM="Thalassionema frauenfeldii, Strain CCMP 1798" /LENGTH=159 /DNA_ID=CAMNT_0020566831 /DNA_START=107 /DNA_END=586 /DNA_ORIENTATION=+